MLKSGSGHRHPFSSLLLLLLLMFGGAFLFTLLVMVLVMAVYGLQPVMTMSEGGASSIEVIRLLQIFTSTGMFIVPAIFFARLESKDWAGFLKLKSVPVILVLLTVLIMLSSGPFLEWSTEVNKAMKLPAFLKDLEEWMRQKELQMAQMTKQLLKMESPGILMINLLMLAVIPALGEEFIFRGCLQKIFARWTGNKHAAIWIAAIIFSAIHFQFYGFIPRMLLGALFGYLLVWSGSIWIPVIAHFMNNSVAVITAFVYQQKGIPLDKLDQSEPVSWLVYAISVPAFAALLWVFYQNSRIKNLSTEGTDGSRLD